MSGSLLTTASDVCPECVGSAAPISHDGEGAHIERPGTTSKDSLRPARFLIRVAAFLIDFYLAGFFVGVIGVLLRLSPVGDEGAAWLLGNGIVPRVAWWLVFLAYFPVFTAITGRTIGKWLLNLRVIDEASGRPQSVWQSVSRTLGYLVSSFFGGLGFLRVAFRRTKHRGWHDELAGTAVLRGPLPMPKQVAALVVLLAGFPAFALVTYVSQAPRNTLISILRDAQQLDRSSAVSTSGVISSDEDGFAIRFPGPVAIRTSQEDGIPARDYLYESSEGTYLVNVAKVPGVESMQLKKLRLENVVKVLATHVGGTVIGSEILTFQGWDAAETLISTPDGLVRAMVVLAEDRVITVMYAGSGLANSEARYESFLHGFELRTGPI